MKLQTSIKPRSNGTVNLVGQNGKTYTFVPNEDGALLCDVDDADTVAHVLRTQPDHVWPFDEEAYNEAERLLTDLEDDDEDEDGDDSAGSAGGGLPIEANTPPKTAPDKAAKANTRVKKALAAEKSPAPAKKAPAAKKAAKPKTGE